MKKEFIIETGIDPGQLTENVQKRLEEGFDLCGFMTFLPTIGRLVQPLYRHRWEDEDKAQASLAAGVSVDPVADYDPASGQVPQYQPSIEQESVAQGGPTLDELRAKAAKETGEADRAEARAARASEKAAKERNEAQAAQAELSAAEQSGAAV
jgi:hypothetical protein